MKDVRRALGALFLIIVLVGAGFLLARHLEKQEREEVAATQLDAIVVALRENRNRLEVRRLSGTVTTRRAVTGGPADLLRGEMTVRQPWSVTYFADMGKLSLDDYRWDPATRTLTVRPPAATPDPPNIDESRQVVGYQGPFITRDMQTKLRAQVANGARQQAAAEAAKPDNLLAANEAAKAAIARNLRAPLAAAGRGDVTVVVRSPAEGRQSGEQWDVSPSIADVLARRAGR
ncbi:MAG TPA: hypothetical protein VM913_04675 [Sphingomicrobium sp.]|nr:hypothetical protein [Sphingomicrobium sp.]